MKTRKMLFAAAVTAAALVSMSPVHAADAAPRTTVNYSDLNLDQPSDTSKLYRRLRAASERVCASFEGMSLHERKMYLACVTESLDAAVTSVNHSSVFAIHDSKRRNVRLASANTSTTPRS